MFALQRRESLWLMPPQIHRNGPNAIARQGYRVGESAGKLARDPRWNVALCGLACCFIALRESTPAPTCRRASARRCALIQKTSSRLSARHGTPALAESRPLDLRAAGPQQRRRTARAGALIDRRDHPGPPVGRGTEPRPCLGRAGHPRGFDDCLTELTSLNVIRLTLIWRRRH
jgi:hypothetical protein